MRSGLGSTRAIRSPSRATLNLSYFDHPPLHQWIVHFAARALGEGFGARLPFIALFAATGWISLRLTLELFGARAALVALFALNVSAVLLRLRGDLDRSRRAAAVRPGCRRPWALARLVLVPAAGRSLDLAVSGSSPGVGLGLAGLSKYSAALSVVGLAAFVVLAPAPAALARPSGALRRRRASRLQ